MPRPRPLPKKRERSLGAGVQAVVSDLPQVLGDAAGTHVLDEGGVVGEVVIRGEIKAFSHVPLEAELLGLDPVVGNSLVRTGVLDRAMTNLAWGSTSTAGFVSDGGRGRREGGDETGTILSTLQVLLEKSPVVPF